MNSVKEARRFTLTVLAVSPLALVLWWFLLEPVILPALEATAGSLLQGWFAREGLSISTGPGMDWIIDTRFLMEPPPYTHTLETYLDFVILTLGLPVLWAFSLGFYRRPQGLNLLVGSMGEVLVICLTVLVKGIHHVYAVMARRDVLNLYLDPGAVIPLTPVPAWELQGWLILANVLGYCAVLVFPLGWCCWANQSALGDMLCSAKAAAHPR